MVQNTQKRPRGRPRAYDPDLALATALATFWQKGFAATSLDDLCEAMNMNRPSLYAAFGDKRALYLTAFDRYMDAAETGTRAALDGSRPLREELRRFYDRALALYLPDKSAPRGCFMIGTAATEAVHDDEIRKRLGAGLRKLAHLLEARMRMAQKRGELGTGVDPKALAEIASAVLHSLAVRARAGDSRKALDALADAGVRLICGE